MSSKSSESKKGTTHHKTESGFAKKEKLTLMHKLGLLLVSLSVLMLEFTLIRVLSISLWYHFAFMIISIALLGLGISGVTIIISKRISKAEINSFILNIFTSKRITLHKFVDCIQHN